MAVPDRHRRPSRTALVLLLLACFTLITLDVRGGDDSPVDPVRSAMGDFFGPVESVTAAVVRPLGDRRTVDDVGDGLADGLLLAHRRLEAAQRLEVRTPHERQPRIGARLDEIVIHDRAASRAPRT